MASDNLTLKLDGVVSLGDFASVMQSLKTLVESLSAEIAGARIITWQVDDLRAGSASATIVGLADDQQDVERVVRAYGVIGKSLERSEPIPFSDKVAKSAKRIVQILGDQVTAVRFETPEDEATVVSPLAKSRYHGPTGAFSGLEGQVETITKRKGLRFVLYDSMNDHPVSCYLQEGQEELMHGIWGKRVLVEGWTSRDPVSGLPTSIRGIKRLLVIHEPERGSFRKARGAVQADPSGPSSEDVIRRLRDA